MGSDRAISLDSSISSCPPLTGTILNSLGDVGQALSLIFLALTPNRVRNAEYSP